MKHLYFCFFLVIFCSKAFCQTNLVQNPSFEMHDTCPHTNDINRCTSWYSVAYDHPNYFNSCATNSAFSVPSNIGGYQFAASGNAYVGLAVYTSFNTPPSSYSETIESQLINPLVIGQKYYMKLKLNCAMGQDNSAIDKVGIRFTNTQHNSSNNFTFFNNSAHLYAPFIVNDTTNWTDIFGSFIADSAYTFIEVGNFFDYQHVNVQIIRPWGSGTNSAFYFVDDICVSTDSLYTTGWQWTTGVNNVSNEENISLFPNPSLNGFVYANKSFTNENAVIYDVLGNNVKSFSMSGNKIDLTDLQNGIYFIQISNEHNYCKQKIIIQKQ